MIQTTRFDSRRDNEPVYPNLCIDLEAALRTNSVVDSGTSVEYNGIEDPSLIRKRVSDTFEAIDERNSVVNKELNRIKSSETISTDESKSE